MSTPDRVATGESDVIYHLTKSSAWKPADGRPYAPASLASEGFIHASAWRQIPGVATGHFARQDDIICLEIDTPSLPRQPVWEDLYGLGETYPHLYSEIPVEAVTGVLNVTWDETGAPVLRRRGAPRDLTVETLHWVDVERPGRTDIALLARLNSQLIEDEGHDNPMNRLELEERMRKFLAGSYRAIFLRMGELSAGYALVDPAASPVHIRQFFIQRGLRRAGVGSRAFADLKEHLGTDRLSVDVLASHGAARRFWHSVGFDDRSVRMVMGPSRPAKTVTDTSQELRFVRIAGETDEASGFLKERIKGFNDSASPYHLHARNPGGVRGVAVMLRDDDGRWRGGISGEVYWEWLAIDEFWIAPEFRGRGLGTRLLEEIEQMGRSRGARRARLYTFSFQAPEFYRRFGYQVVGEMKDYPPGQSLFWLRKDL